MLKMMIDIVKSKGFQIVTLKTLVEKTNLQATS